jgi:hypothetical protein
MIPLFILLFLVAVLQLAIAGWVEYEDCYVVTTSYRGKNVSCVLPIGLIEDADRLTLRVYVEMTDAFLHLQNMATKKIVYSKELFAYDDRPTVKITRVFLEEQTSGVNIIIENRSKLYDSLLGLSASVYYLEDWEKWQLWVPIVVVCSVVLGCAFNVVLILVRCYIFRKKETNSLAETSTATAQQSQFLEMS